MHAHITDSVFFKDMYGTEAMRGVFTDEALLQYWLDVVYRVSKRAYEEHLSLKEALMQEPDVTLHMSSGQIDDLLKPDTYTGFSGVFVDRVVGYADQARGR